MTHRDDMIEVWTDCKRAYQLTFNTPAGLAVLADMEWFWRAKASCIAVIDGKIDVHKTFILEGRHEVYLRIRDYLDLTPEQLVDKYTTPAQGAQGNEL